MPRRCPFKATIRTSTKRFRVRNTSQRLQEGRFNKPLFTEDGEQSGSVGGAGAWQCSKQGIVGKRLSSHINPSIEAFDGLQAHAQLLDEGLRHERTFAATDAPRGARRGFSLDAKVRIEARDRAGLERLLRYCARPIFASERLAWASTGDRVVYALPKPGPLGQRCSPSRPWSS